MSTYAVKGAPFRYKGVFDVSDCNTSKEVMIAAGLDWFVSKCELVAKMPSLVSDTDSKDSFLYGGDAYRTCPNAYATYRTDKNIPLGIVKDRYAPVQNIDAFNFFDGAIGKDKAVWQTAGCFGNGERIFVSAKLPKNILVNGDPIENYLVFTTSHDGSSGVKILFTPIRVVCQNTLNAAIRTTTNYVSFRHTSTVHEKLDTAAEILGICDNQVYMLQQHFNQMIKTHMTDEAAMKVFGQVILTDNEIQNIKDTGHTIEQICYRDNHAINDTGISMKKVNVIAEMNNYYFSGVGQKQHLGTAFGVYNAVNGYYSNVDNAVGEKRMDSLLFGDKSRKIKAAGDYVLDLAV